MASSLLENFFCLQKGTSKLLSDAFYDTFRREIKNFFWSDPEKHYILSIYCDGRSDFVKPLGIFSQDQLLVFIADIMSVLDFIDLVASILHRNFMREIGREHARLWTNKIHDTGQSPLISLTAHIKLPLVK